MPEVRPSAAPTHTLLRALIDNIQRSRDSSTHLRETEEFLAAVSDHLTWYDALLHKLSNESTIRAKDQRAAIEAICQLVYEKIEEVKGLCEGTSERIPFVLATLLNHEFRLQEAHFVSSGAAEGDGSTAAGKSVGIAFCPISQANYWYMDIGAQFKDAFDLLDSELDAFFSHVLPSLGLPLRPSFPESLVLIGFQYAMVDDILFNAILYHELGHHVFNSRKANVGPDTAGTTALFDAYYAEVDKFVDKWLRANDNEYNTRSTSEQAMMHRLPHVEVLMNWVSEIFCDAFAITACGPNYRFAAKDLILAESADRSFARTHPAGSLRQHQQTVLLNQLGWTRAPMEEPPPLPLVTETLEVFQTVCATIDLANQQWDVLSLKDEVEIPESNAQMLVAKLIDLCPQILADARGCVADADMRAAEFWLLGNSVKTALANAIVPSSIVIDGGELPKGVFSTPLPGGIKRFHPRPSTVMNWARVLYQTDCIDLLKVWPNAMRGGEVQHDAMLQIRKRLSEWTRKAVADWLLLMGAAHHGDRKN